MENEIKLNNLKSQLRKKESIALHNNKTILTKELEVTKANGTIERFNFSMIEQMALWACDDNKSLAKILLEETSIKLYNKMKTFEIQEQLVKTAENLISRLQPQWEYVAAKLYLVQLYKVVGNGKYPLLEEYIKKGMRHKILHPDIFNSYTPEEITELNNYMKIDRDYLFTIKGLRIFAKKYHLRTPNTKKAIELPQITYMRVAMGLHWKKSGLERIERIKALYNLLSTHKITLATPILLNAGTVNNQLASCVLNKMNDDSISIMDVNKDLAIYSKFKGGTALDIDELRASDTYIEGNQGTSSGPVPFIKITEQIMKAWNQGCVSKSNVVKIIDTIEKDGVEYSLEDFIKLFGVEEINNYNEDDEGIVCQICGKKFDKQINNTHLKKHDISTKEYKNLYGVLQSNERIYEQSKFMISKKENSPFSKDFYIKKGFNENDSIVLAKNKIKTKTIPIVEVKKGDYIKSFDIINEKSRFNKILDILEPVVKEENQIRFKFKNSSTSIITSKTHPMCFFNELEKKWEYKESQYIKLNDIVKTENKLLKVCLIDEKYCENENNFIDFTVEKDNNYYVSNNEKDFVVIHNSTRPGACAIYFSYWHYNFEELIVLKNNGGIEENRARGLKYTIKLNELFIKRWMDNKDITLFNPKEVPLLLHTFGEEWDKAYENYEKTSGIMKKKINARDMWKQIIKERSETGNIYIFWIDNVNKQNMLNKMVTQSNLCIDGEAIVSTLSGNKKLKEIKIGDKVKSYNEVTNEITFETVLDSKMTMKNAHIVKIEDMKANKSLICTPEHSIYTKNRGYVQALYLKEDDELLINE